MMKFKSRGTREQAKKMVVQLLVDRPRLVLVDDCNTASSKVVVLQTSFMAKHSYLANGDQQGHAHLQGAWCMLCALCCVVDLCCMPCALGMPPCVAPTFAPTCAPTFASTVVVAALGPFGAA